MMGVFSVSAEPADYDLSTTVLGALAAFFTWTTLYFTLCLFNSKRSYEWNCRIVATLHAVTVVILTAWSGFVQGPWPFTDAGAPNTRLHHWTCVICLGYFIWDLIWCLYFGTEGTVMILHHCLSLFGQFYVLYLGTDGVEMIATLFGSELSNPFLQFRWFLKAAACHKTWYGEVNDHVFMLLFGILRIGVGTYLLYTTYMSPKPDLIVKLGALALYVISWVFWYMIVSYAIRKYRKMFTKQAGSSKTQEADKTKDKSLSGAGDSHLRKRRPVQQHDKTPTESGVEAGLQNGDAGLKSTGAGLICGESGLRNGNAGLVNGEVILVNHKDGPISSNGSDTDHTVSVSNGHVKVE